MDHQCHKRLLYEQVNVNLHVKTNNCAIKCNFGHLLVYIMLHPGKKKCVLAC